MSTAPGPISTEHFLNQYGEMVYDLCSSLLRTPSFANLVFRDITHTVQARGHSERFSKYERPWVLRLAYEILMDQFPRFGRRVSHQNRIQLDTNVSNSPKLDHFPEFFSRLEPQDQILLILRDKFGVPLDELATTFGVPEGSLRVRHQQALRTLEEWMWNER